MAQTKRKRRSKHRGTPAGTVEARGRTGRKLKAEERGKPATTRRDRFSQPPTWRSATIRAGIAAGIFLVAVIGLFRQPVAGAISISLLMFALYIPLGYYTDRFLYNRRRRQQADSGRPKGKAG